MKIPQEKRDKAHKAGISTFLNDYGPEEVINAAIDALENELRPGAKHAFCLNCDSWMQYTVDWEDLCPNCGSTQSELLPTFSWKQSDSHGEPE